MLTEWPIKDRPCCMNKASNCRGAPKFGWEAPWLLATPLTNVLSARLLAAADLYCTNACTAHEARKCQYTNSSCCTVCSLAWQASDCSLSGHHCQLVVMLFGSTAAPALQMTPQSAVANTMPTDTPYTRCSAEYCNLSTLQVCKAAMPRNPLGLLTTVTQKDDLHH